MCVGELSHGAYPSDSTTYIEGGYYFHPCRYDTFAAYYIPLHGDSRGRYLGDHFPTAEAAEYAIHQARLDS